MLSRDEHQALNTRHGQFVASQTARDLCLAPLKEGQHHTHFTKGSAELLCALSCRVAVEYLNTDAEVQKKKYAFKCHRVKQDGTEHIYPVNAVSFHRGHNTFATGGSDGFVNIWDPFNKKRLCQFHRYSMDVASLSINWEGSMVAIAVSRVWQEDDVQPGKDAIFVRHVTDNETQPKPTNGQ